MKFDAVFFDSGGTLYGYGESADPTSSEVAEGRFGRLSAALAAYGHDLEPHSIEERLVPCEEVCKEALGHSYNFFRLIKQFCQDMSFDFGPEVAACLTDAYAGPRFASWLYPGVTDTVRELSGKGFYLGIIANTYWPGFCMDRAFDGVGLLPYFKTRIYSGDLGIAKPDPEIFHLAEEISGLKGKSILYVGDTLDADIQGASTVGWKTAFHTRRGYSRDGMADFDYSESGELLRYVLQHRDV
jgi:HAD superfamily hydrolase (TIGR01549 family)